MRRMEVLQPLWATCANVQPPTRWKSFSVCLSETKMVFKGYKYGRGSRVENVWGVADIWDEGWVAEVTWVVQPWVDKIE